MNEQICKSCKFFNGQCQNFNLSRHSKTMRRNRNECEYWEERKIISEEGLKASLLSLASQLQNIADSLKDDEE